MVNCNVKDIRKKTMSKVEGIFFKHGQMVAKWPKTTILLSLLVIVISALGILKLDVQYNYFDLWIPTDADSSINIKWLGDNFPSDIRVQSLILKADNILTPDIIKTLYKIHRSVEETLSSNGSSWSSHCKRIPVVKKIGSFVGRRRRQTLDEYDYYSSFGDDYDGDFNEISSLDPSLYSSINSYPEPYCRVLESYPKECMEFGILELFGNNGQYNEEQIYNITLKQILDTINYSNESGIFITERNFTKYLGGIKYDDENKIAGASATIVKYFTEENRTSALIDPADAGRAYPTSKEAYQFELALLSTLLNKTYYPKGLESSPNVAHGRALEIDRAIDSGMPLIIIGFIIMVVYVSLMIGKSDHMWQTAWLTIPALITIVGGLIFSAGICSVLGVPATDLHKLVPLILLAIGIDDAFVVVAALDNLSQTEKQECLEIRFGLVMKKAGVSITITSLTDILAFAAGGSTVIYGMHSFFIYCSVGLIAIYFLIITFFLATMVLKQRHVDNSRNGCIPCITSQRDEITEENKSNITMSCIFEKYAIILMKTPVKICLLIFSFVILAVGIWGSVLIQYYFYSTDIINKGTYIQQWFGLQDKFFSGEVETAAFYVTDMKSNDFFKINQLITDLRKEDSISEVSSWTEEFTAFVNLGSDVGKTKLSDRQMSDDFFQTKLTQFLYSPDGSKFQPLFTFDSNSSLECGISAPTIRLARVPYSHTLMLDNSVYLPAKNKIYKMVKDAKFSGHSFAFSNNYLDWETEEAILIDFPRYLSVSLVSIFIVTIVLLMDIKQSFLVIICIVMSLIDTIGYLHFWGITINLYTGVLIIMSTGLCVDYSVHIAQSFLCETGTSRQRVIKAVREVGPAVFNGGVSTFLAISIIGTSDNFTWQLYFKSFTMITLFGIFHGLVFLPIMLSIVYSNDENSKDNNVNIKAGEDNPVAVLEGETTST